MSEQEREQEKLCYLCYHIVDTIRPGQGAPGLNLLLWLLRPLQPPGGLPGVDLVQGDPNTTRHLGGVFSGNTIILNIIMYSKLNSQHLLMNFDINLVSENIMHRN